MKNSILLLFLCTSLFNCNVYCQIPPDGLIGHYKLNGDALDSSDYLTHGNIIGSLSSTFDRNGNVSGAMSFNGGYIKIQNAEPFVSAEELSISVWVNISRVNDWVGLVSKWEGWDAGGFYLGINPEDEKIRWNVDMPNYIEGNVVDLNEWTHYAATHDGVSTKLFQNGILTDSVAFNTPIISNFADVIIGGQSNLPGELVYDGDMDDLLFYNRALSADEVEQIYNFTPLDIEELSLDQISIYPNPTNGEINIRNLILVESTVYTVMNVQGQIMEHGFCTGNKLDVSEMSSGIYFLRLKNEKQILNQKFILK